MAKTRLLKRDREALREFAQNTIKVIPTKEAVALANQKFKDLAAVDIKKRLPEKDMAVLRRFQGTSQQTSFSGAELDTGRFISVQFSTEEAIEAPQIGCYSTGAFTKRIVWSRATIEAFDAFEIIEEDHRKALKEKLDKYRALITAARYFEEILEVWPAASALTSQITKVSQDIVAVSAETVDFIRSDNAGAKA